MVASRRLAGSGCGWGRCDAGWSPSGWPSGLGLFLLALGRCGVEGARLGHHGEFGPCVMNGHQGFLLGVIYASPGLRVHRGFLSSGYCHRGLDIAQGFLLVGVLHAWGFPARWFPGHWGYCRGFPAPSGFKPSWLCVSRVHAYGAVGLHRGFLLIGGSWPWELSIIVSSASSSPGLRSSGQGFMAG